MTVVGIKRLDEFSSKHSDASGAIQSWLAEVRDASWRTPHDVKQRFVAASVLPENRVVFNLRGNRYRLEVSIAYQTGVVVVRRIGTHAEYDKWK